MKAIAVLLSVITLLSCALITIEEKMEDDLTMSSLDYLALGDSYTIGESVGEEERFPAQLFNSEFDYKIEKGEYKIIARTGWTSRNLLDAMEKENLKKGDYNFITLLIGVNNQYQGKPFSQYESELNELIDKAIHLLEGRSDRLIVVSIPDYSVSPFAASSNKTKIAEEIKKYNTFKQETTKSKGARFVYITDLTQNANEDLSLLAFDQLHPSGKSYAQWVSRILPVLHDIIKN